jgi:2-polyprenyl-3-methyl-5-hydroxy-6-metoxy-1,4-benzoquinol methylase
LSSLKAPAERTLGGLEREEAGRAPRVRALAGCPVCESTRSEQVFVAPDFLLGVPGEYRYVRCVACATVFQDPRVLEADLPICYSTDYFTHHLPEGEAVHLPVSPDTSRGRLRTAILEIADGRRDHGIGAAWTMAGWLLARVPSLRRRARFGLPDELGLKAPGQRCLEVGPGRGFDLLQLRRIGWKAEGLEMDAAAAANARAISGCEVHVGTLVSSDLPSAAFHLIYMNHVLEHLPDLERSLARCFDLLVPGGRLFVAYPNPRALTASIHGRFSVVWDPPRHLSLPPARALSALLSRLGFVEARSRTSARRAEAYRAATVRHRGGARGFAAGGPSLSDRAFGILERFLVLAGAGVGEEILVVARRPGGA